MIGRCRTEVMLPVEDVEAMTALLRPLTAGVLRDVATRAGIARPEKDRAELLRRIEGKLNAGRRVMAQTWC